MYIRFTDGNLKNRMFASAKIDDNRKNVTVFDEGIIKTISLENKAYELFGFDS